jgi:tetratricopeptide (TPR) repeat protein
MEREQGIPNLPPLLDSLDLIRVDLWQRGDPERAAARLDATLAALPLSLLPEPDRPYGDLGALYAMVGSTDQARSVLARIEQIGDTTLRRIRQSDAHRVRAEIAMAEGRPRDALDEFRRADQGPDGPLTSDPSPTLFRLARAFDLANEPDSAIAMFEQYLATRQTSRAGSDAFWLPAIQKRLGELYEAKGDRAKAATHYAVFVDLWKDADPELRGEVAEVKRRLAALGEEGKK